LNWAPLGPDFDFGSSAILVSLANGKRALIAGQKSGVVTAVDPDRGGAILWQARVGHGGALGGAPVDWLRRMKGVHTDPQLRAAGAAIKDEVLAHLDRYLLQLEEQVTEPSRPLHESLALNHPQGREASGCRQVAAAERGAVDHTALHRVERRVEHLSAREQRSGRHVAAGQRVQHVVDLRLVLAETRHDLAADKLQHLRDVVSQRLVGATSSDCPAFAVGRFVGEWRHQHLPQHALHGLVGEIVLLQACQEAVTCLLYTSDAADE